MIVYWFCKEGKGPRGKKKNLLKEEKIKGSIAIGKK
jgi:hypothetical protein